MGADELNQIRIYIADKDDLDHTFEDNSDGDPILQWQDFDAEHRVPGWRVWYVEPDGNGVESEFIAGAEVDVETGLRWARETVRNAWRA